MYYNVAQLLKEPLGSTRTYGINDPVSIDGGTTQLIPPCQIALMRTDKGIWVSGGVKLRSRVTCSRCLKGFACPMGILIEEEYLAQVDVNTGQSLYSSEGTQDTFTIGPQHVLDLTEAIRQYSITNRPMKPLCGLECRGLCPICGADRNEYPCSCRDGEVDPRWSPLVKLLEGISS